MMIANPANCEEYVFVFRGGTCGSFLKLIWNYYLRNGNKKGLFYNKTMGHAHVPSPFISKHYHNVGDIPILKEENPNIKIILIMFDEDDIELISKMQYLKVAKEWLKHNLDEAILTWPELQEGIVNLDTRQQTWQNHYIEGCKHWLSAIEKDKADFIIDFKTIYGNSDTNLNQLISNYLNVPASIEVDNYITEYRLINHKLYGKK